MTLPRCCVVLLLLALTAHLGAQESVPKYPPPAEVKAAFLKLLDRPKVPLDAKTEDSRIDNGLVIERLSFASEKKADGAIERVPVLLVRPEKVDKKLPAVISLHGTGGNKESQLKLLTELARKGIIGVAIDARYHGARSGGAKGAAAYVEAITRAWRTRDGAPQEHPFFYEPAGTCGAPPTICTRGRTSMPAASA